MWCLFNKIFVSGTPLKDFFKQERWPRVQWIVRRKFQIRGAKWMTSMSGRISNLRTLHKAWLEKTLHRKTIPSAHNAHATDRSSRNVERKLFLFARHSLEQHLCTHQFVTWLLSKFLTNCIHSRPHISRDPADLRNAKEEYLNKLLSISWPNFVFTNSIAKP